MSLSLPVSILNLFKKKTDQYKTGIAILSNKVQLVKLKVTDSQVKCVASTEVDYGTEDELMGVMKSLITNYNIVDSETTIVLPASKTESTQIDRSELPAAEVSAALPWKIKELVNIAPQDMMCDYIDMPLQPTGQAPKVQVIAVSKNFLSKLLQPFHDANAPIGAITTEQFALAKLQQTKDAAQLIFIQRKNADAILLIIKNQQICFGRKIRNTASVIDMSPEQLQMGGSDTIAIEIQRSIDYFESQLKQPPIKNALLAMDGNNTELMISLLNQVLPVKTKPISVEDIDSESSLPTGLISALGAALYCHSSVVSEEGDNVEN